MDTEDQGAKPEGTVLLRAPAEGSTFSGLCESSSPFPLSVGPWLLELDGLLRQERLLAA